MAPRAFTLTVCVLVVLLLTDCGARHRRQRPRRRRRPPLSVFPHRLHATFAAVANNFTWNMYKQLAPGRENLVFSPISVFKTLSMAHLGSSNNTARELYNVLGYRAMKRPRKVRKAFRHLWEMMRIPMRNVTLKMADAMYIHESIHVRNRFLRRLRKFYKAKIRKYNHDSKVDAMASMKKWIRRQTLGKMRNIEMNLSVNRKRALWLVNAVYLNGSWDVVFDQSMTNRSMFNVDRYTRTPVDMMFNDWRFYYKVNSELKVKVLEIPYASHRLSFFLILPDDVNGLETLEHKLTSSSFQDLITDMSGPARFYVRMPKMSLMSDIDLKPYLRTMGINDVFGRNADLSPIDGTRHLFIDHVMHMSALDVDEGGSVGAGVTGAGIALRSVPPEFKADRPFMFVIKDKTTKTDLFMGKFSNPNAT